ncbi:Hypothetical predicted protein [Mytilus galloprovincialis]|uniref:MULE transposase domain-containing protein n=1 Tax=Mytilus galloprovincialis TaxID=29158 RepID=A0A8B6GA15_MYTGA|nr:Hypothetical predicted protein [Mytilus galloprovincialis]
MQCTTSSESSKKFRVKTRRDERVYWICTTRNCPATLNTRNNIPTKLPNGHNHDSHKVKLKVDEILQTIKKRCREETTPVPTIYEQEVIKLRNPEWNDETQEVVENLPTFESCRGSFYNERSKLIPALPKTRNEINLAEPWTVTTVGEQFLMADDGLHDRIMMFTTRQNLTHLTAADIIYGDGTFYTCPDVFFQLYTFHAFVDGAIYPLVYALLPGKSQIIYTRFLTLLKEACQRFDLQLQPTTIFLDYEVAVRNAAYQVFPGITGKGCFFHYTQCIWRKAQDTGLQTHYKNNNDITRLVRRAAVLPLVPMQHVEDIWLNALEEIDEANTNINTLAFTDYVTEYWVETNRHLWNHYDTVGPRTNNHLEGWHHKLKNHVEHPHPNIFNLVKLLKKQQAAIEVRLIQYSAGGKRRQRKRKYIEIDTRLADLKQRLQDNSMTPVEYADAASYLLHIN